MKFRVISHIPGTEIFNHYIPATEIINYIVDTQERRNSRHRRTVNIEERSSIRHRNTKDQYTQRNEGIGDIEEQRDRGTTVDTEKQKNSTHIRTKEK